MRAATAVLVVVSTAALSMCIGGDLLDLAASNGDSGSLSLHSLRPVGDPTQGGLGQSLRSGPSAPYMTCPENTAKNMSGWTTTCTRCKAGTKVGICDATCMSSECAACGEYAEFDVTAGELPVRPRTNLTVCSSMCDECTLVDQANPDAGECLNLAMYEGTWKTLMNPAPGSGIPPATRPATAKTYNATYSPGTLQVDDKACNISTSEYTFPTAVLPSCPSLSYETRVVVDDLERLQCTMCESLTAKYDQPPREAPATNATAGDNSTNTTADERTAEQISSFHFYLRDRTAAIPCQKECGECHEGPGKCAHVQRYETNRLNLWLPPNLDGSVPETYVLSDVDDADCVTQEVCKNALC